MPKGLKTTKTSTIMKQPTKETFFLALVAFIMLWWVLYIFADFIVSRI